MRRFLRLLTRGGPIVLALLVVAAARGDAPEPLARYVPRDDLAAYFEFEGLDARPEAWGRTALARVLNETSTGAMLRDLAAGVINGFNAQANAGDVPATGDEMVRAFETVARSGAVLALHSSGDRSGPLAGTVVLRGAAGDGVRDLFDRLVRSNIGSTDTTQVLTRQDGRKLVIVRPNTGPGWAFWPEKDDLVIVWGRAEDGADPVIAALEGKRPNAVEHPRRVGLAKAEDGFQPVAWAFLDPATFPAESLDLKGIEQVDYRWGFRGSAVQSITRLVAPKPRRGWLALFDQPALTRDTIPPMPAGLDGYTIASIDPARTFDQIGAWLGAGSLDGLQQAVFQQTGLKLKEDLLARLGPRWAAFVPRETARVPLTPWGGLAQWIYHLPRATLMAETSDPAALGESLEALASTANAALSEGRDPTHAVRLSPLKSPDRGFGLDVPADLVPLPAGLRPCVMLGDRHVVLTTRPDWGRAVLQLTSEPGKRLIPDLDSYPPGLIFLNVSDPRGSMPELLANLPFVVQLMTAGPGLLRGPRFAPPLGHLRLAPEKAPTAESIRDRLFPNSIALAVDDRQIRLLTRESIPGLNTVAASPLTVALILPAVQASRAAARRSQSVNNLKQIALAMHNFHSVNNHFPAAAIVDKDDKPLLSWRVAILPYIEQQALYNEFHLDEPWDSPHNKTLIERMPNIYAIPGAATPMPHMTYYQALVGGGALFNAAMPVALQDVTDGTSNTIMAVEAARAVPWTKPEDLPYSPEKPLPKFGMHFSGGFNAAFADGSVRFLKMSINPDVLRALITRAGGEVINANDF